MKPEKYTTKILVEAMQLTKRNLQWVKDWLGQHGYIDFEVDIYGSCGDVRRLTPGSATDMNDDYEVLTLTAMSATEDKITITGDDWLVKLPTSKFICVPEKLFEAVYEEWEPLYAAQG